MVSLGSMRISMVQLVRRFAYTGKEKDIRFRVFDFENAFKEHFSESAVLSPNAQDAPPDVPRFIFQQGNRQLIAAGTAVQLSLLFDKDVDLPEVESQIKKYSKIMDDCLDGVLNDVQNSYSGIIVYINRPYGGKEADVAKEIARQLISKECDNPLSVSVNIGYKSGNLAHTVSVSGYRAYKNVASSEFLSFSTCEFSEASEHGLQIKLDVNSKNTLDNKEYGKFSYIYSGVMEMLKNEAPKYLGDLFSSEGL